MAKRIKPNTNKLLLRECKKRQWGPKEVWQLLNQGHTSVERTTVSKWFVNPKLPGALKMKGHWLDLFNYRLIDFDKKNARS